MLDHPFSPGETSAVEPGPWHYGADYVAVYFKGERANLKSLVPTPFEVGGGECIAYVCEIVSVSDSSPELVATAPERTYYREAAVGVRCSFDGREGVFFPVMWVTTEWSLLRGLLNGYQKRLADGIFLTRLHDLNPGLRPLGVGTKLSGFCVKGPEAVLSVKVNLESRADASALPKFGPTFGMRRFPQTDASQASVGEAVEILKSNQKTADVWLGSGSVETVLDVGRPTNTMGAVYRTGFTISGSRVLSKA